MSATRLATTVVRFAAAFAVLFAGSTATLGQGGAAIRFDGARVALDACLSAGAAVENARSLLKSRNPTYRPFLEAAHADVADAQAASAQPAWPTELRRRHRYVDRSLAAAVTWLSRSENPRIAARFVRVARNVNAAKRSLARATLLLDGVAPPALTDAPVTTPPAINAPSDFVWTSLSPSADSRIVYVSNVDGNDAWDGLYPDHALGGNHGPMQTWWGSTGAISKLRPGYPDWLLLKRGETWTFTNDLEVGVPPDWNWRQRVTRRLVGVLGRSAAEPSVISTYGDHPDRPLLVNTCLSVENSVVNGANVGASHCRVIGLNFLRTDERNPGAGVTVAGINTTDVLIEDCKFDGYASGVIISAPSASEKLSNVRVRGCVIANAYSSQNPLAQGIFANVTDGILIEGCVIDHNGWHDDTIPLVSGLSIDATTKLITRSTGSFITDGYAACATDAHYVQLLGFSNGANNQRYEVGAVTATTLELIGNGTNGRADIANLVSEGTDSSHEVTVEWLGGTFAHNTYFGHDATNVVFRGNIVARGGGMGIRAGGLIEDNLILSSTFSNTNNLVPTIVRRNVWLDGDNIHEIDGQNAGWGISIGFYGTRYGTPVTTYPIQVYDNIWAHNVHGRQPIGLLFGPNNYPYDGVLTEGPVHDFSLHDNIFYNYGRALWPSDHVIGICGSGNSITRNTFVTKATGGPVSVPNDAYYDLVYSNVALDPLLNFSDNRYWSEKTTWWEAPALNLFSDAEEWETQSGETGATYTEPSFLDPTRTVASYNASIGGAATLEAFLNEARKQSKTNWRAAYTAGAVNEYIRRGFNLVTH